MSATSTDTTHEVFLADELLARCMGSVDFATRVLAKFQDRFAADLAELDEAVSAQDADAVARIAHRIKGASANVAAAQLRTCSAGIEQMGRARHLEELPTCMDRLREEWARFVDHTATLGLGVYSAR